MRLEAELLLAFRRGDRDALERVYEGCLPLVVAWARRGFGFSAGGERLRFRGCRSPLEVLDVVHDTFCALFDARARRGYSGRHPFDHYLRTVMRNVVMDRLREASARARKHARFGREPPDFAPTPEEIVRRGEGQRMAEEILAELPPSLRRFVEVRFGDELSQEATARALGTTRKRVRTMERTVRRLLIARLRAGGGFAAQPPRGPARR